MVVPALVSNTGSFYCLGQDLPSNVVLPSLAQDEEAFPVVAETTTETVYGGILLFFAK